MTDLPPEVEPEADPEVEPRELSFTPPPTPLSEAPPEVLTRLSLLRQRQESSEPEGGGGDVEAGV